jgi:hypothetical protein
VINAVIIGILFGSIIEKEKAEKEAIAHECAYYTATTREFTWLIPEIKK